MDRIQKTRDRLSEITPWPWQKSYFVDSHKYDRQSEEWKKDARERESKVIRGLGTVGSPSCNPVGIIDTNPWDKEFILNAPQDIDFLLKQNEELLDLMVDESIRYQDIIENSDIKIHYLEKLVRLLLAERKRAKITDKKSRKRKTYWTRFLKDVSNHEKME